MKPFSNGGVLDYTQCGTLIILPNREVYYNPQSISNLMYMSAVTSKYHVTMGIRVEDAIVVNLGRNQNIKFSRCKNDLYYFDNADIGHVQTSQDDITDYEDNYKTSVTGYYFVFTVVTNKE